MSGELIDWLRELRMPGVRDAYQEQAEQARREGHSYERYLTGLIEHEIAERRHHIREAGRHSPGTGGREYVNIAALGLEKHEVFADLTGQLVDDRHSRFSGRRVIMRRRLTSVKRTHRYLRVAGGCGIRRPDAGLVKGGVQ